jgi:hypothetical protein
MAWTKTKMAIVAGAAVLLAAAAIFAVHQYQTRLQPRASWTFAGYADPRSALMSYFYASACQSDRAAFESSLTPDQLALYQRMISMNMKIPRPHSEAETVADTFQRASDEWQNGSYRILNERILPAGQAVLRLHFKNSTQEKDISVKMKKIGNEWKFDGLAR